MITKRSINAAAVSVVKQLVSAGYEAYIVGGAVRDLLLNCTPKDYDIATNATPEQVRAVFGSRQCMVIGRRFRLAQVRVGKEIFEVSTFRKKPSMEERKGRYDDDGEMIWNDNVFGTLEDDVQRRDFTVNALYYDPIGSRGIIDMVNGVQDLKDGIVRVVGDAKTRFAEDPVRMLRALKLVGIHGFTLESSAKKALREKREMIGLSSIARLYEELIKILMTGHSQSIFAAFQQYGFLAFFWGKLSKLWKNQEGNLIQRIMLARDRAIRGDNYTNSRALALSAMALPYVMKRLPCEGAEDPRFDWSHAPGIPTTCLKLVHEFFDRFVMPKLYSLRVRDILLMVPALCNENLASRYYKHKDYKYARLLIGLLVEGIDWDSELFERLPEPDKANAAAPKRRRRRHHNRSSQISGTADSFNSNEVVD